MTSENKKTDDDTTKAIAEAVKESSKALAEALPYLENLAIYIKDGVYSLYPPLWNWFAVRSFKGALNLIEEAAKETRARGLSSGHLRQIPHKLARQILLDGAFEDGVDLRSLWKGLIVNWLDPNVEESRFSPAFIAIIKELSPQDAVILRTIHSAQQKMQKGPVSIETLRSFYPHHLTTIMNIEPNKMWVSLENLERLRLIKNYSRREMRVDFQTSRVTEYSSQAEYKLSYFGEAFVAVCMGPDSHG